MFTLKILFIQFYLTFTTRVKFQKVFNFFILVFNFLVYIFTSSQILSPVILAVLIIQFMKFILGYFSIEKIIFEIILICYKYVS